MDINQGLFLSGICLFLALAWWLNREHKRKEEDERTNKQLKASCEREKAKRAGA